MPTWHQIMSADAAWRQARGVGPVRREWLRASRAMDILGAGAVVRAAAWYERHVAAVTRARVSNRWWLQLLPVALLLVGFLCHSIGQPVWTVLMVGVVYVFVLLRYAIPEFVLELAAVFGRHRLPLTQHGRRSPFILLPIVLATAALDTLAASLFAGRRSNAYWLSGELPELREREIKTRSIAVDVYVVVCTIALALLLTSAASSRVSDHVASGSGQLLVVLILFPTLVSLVNIAVFHGLMAPSDERSLSSVPRSVVLSAINYLQLVLGFAAIYALRGHLGDDAPGAWAAVRESASIQFGGGGQIVKGGGTLLVHQVAARFVEIVIFARIVGLLPALHSHGDSA